jgi:hypothetical protein
MTEDTAVEIREAAADAGLEKPQTDPIHVSEVDRLRAENINLRLLNAVNKETIAQQAAQQAGQARMAANQATLDVRTELEQKYGIDLQTHLIDETTGEVRPRNGGLPPSLAALMGGRG